MNKNYIYGIYVIFKDHERFMEILFNNEKNAIDYVNFKNKYKSSNLNYKLKYKKIQLYKNINERFYTEIENLKNLKFLKE